MQVGVGDTMNICLFVLRRHCCRLAVISSHPKHLNPPLQVATRRDFFVNWQGNSRLPGTYKRGEQCPQPPLGDGDHSNSGPCGVLAPNTRTPAHGACFPGVQRCFLLYDVM